MTLQSTTQSTTMQSPQQIAPTSSAPADRRARASSWGLALALTALLGAVASMAFVGVTVVPMETASGYYLTDTPVGYQRAVLAAFASLLVWTVLGLLAIVLGIIGLVGRRGSTRAVWAIVLAIIAPGLAVLVLSGAMGLGAALL